MIAKFAIPSTLLNKVQNIKHNQLNISILNSFI
jgi:hypothetical protein